MAARRAKRTMKFNAAIKLPKRERTYEDEVRLSIARLNEIINSDKSHGAVIRAIEKKHKLLAELHRKDNDVNVVRVSWLDAEELRNANHA